MTSSRATTAWLATVLAAVAVGVSHGQSPDQQIETQVTQALREEAVLRSVTVSVQEQVVTLGGPVPSLWAKETAIDAARGVEQVRFVVSDLTIARAESDASLWEQVAGRLRRYSDYTMFDQIDMGVDDGVVTLVGKVTAPFKVDDVTRLVSRVPGVREIANLVETLPVSPADDDVRAALAQQIYSHPVLSRYATRSDPPIHIIVERGRVTLIGAVGSRLERRIAETIALGAPGVLSVDNALQTTP